MGSIMTWVYEMHSTTHWAMCCKPPWFLAAIFPQCRALLIVESEPDQIQLRGKQVLYVPIVQASNRIQ